MMSTIISSIRFVVVFLCTCSLSEANIKTVETTFTKGKTVATSHTVLQPVSKSHCVERCHQEEKQGSCTIAGYNKNTRACYLSVDSQHDVVDVADESLGVFFLKGNTVYMIFRDLFFYNVHLRECVNASAVCFIIIFKLLYYENCENNAFRIKPYTYVYCTCTYGVSDNLNST